MQTFLNWRQAAGALAILVAAPTGAGASELPAERPRLEVQSGHQLPVMRVAVDIGRNVVVSSDLTGSIRAWSLRDGRSRLLKAAPLAQRGGLALLVVSNANDWVASAALEDGKLNVQRLSDGVDMTPAGMAPLHRLTISPDGKVAAALTKEGVVQLFDARTWTIRASNSPCRLPEEDLPGDAYGNADFVFSHDGSHLMSANSRGRVTWLDTATGCVARALELGRGAYASVALNGVSGLIAMSDYRTVTVRRLDGGGQPWTFPANDGMRQLLLTNDGQALMTGTSGGTIRRHSLMGVPDTEWTYPEGATALGSDPDDHLIVVGLFSGSVSVVDRKRGATQLLAGAVLLPTQLARAPDGGGLLVLTPARIFRVDPVRGFTRRLMDNEGDGILNVSDDGQWLWRANPTGGTRALRSTGESETSLPASIPTRTWTSSLSPDGQSVAVSFGSDLRLYSATNGNFVSLGRLPHPATRLGYSPDGRWLIASGEASTLQLVDLVTRRIQSLARSSGTESFAFSSDSSALALGGSDGSVRRLELPSLQMQHLRLPSADGRVTALAFSPDGLQLAIGRGGGRVELLSAKGNGEPVRVEPINGDPISLVYLDEALAAVATSGEIKLWRKRRPVASLFLTREGGMVAAAPDGRFESSDLERPGAIAWVLPDTPLQPVPAEFFMRDFLEPRLVPRLLSCLQAQANSPGACEEAFAPVPDLAGINKVQPLVRIEGIRPGSTPDEVIVTVEARAGFDATQPAGKQHSDAYDVHLLRNGQVVGRWPTADGASKDLSAWRETTRATDSSRSDGSRHEFKVRIPVSDNAPPVTFGAYAFNEDRMKTATIEHPPLEFRHKGLDRKPRAYIVTLGANQYEDPARALSFAVRDAMALQKALRRIEGYEVVPVRLISRGPAATWTATKAALRAVLLRLGGGPPSVELRRLPGASKLAPATPDDLVVVSFSGHGHVQPDGSFYLVASDSGSVVPRLPDGGLPKDALDRFISTDELDRWMRSIDAGAFTVILDACHSAGSLQQPGFKPAPLGDRGLGQLAYDKGMQVLAASQSGDVAIESSKLRHGLLTFALVREALSSRPNGRKRADIDNDGRLTLSEWLQFAEQRTPALYEDIKANRLTAVYVGKAPKFLNKDTGHAEDFRQAVLRGAQTPTLFDFRRGHEIVLP